MFLIRRWPKSSELWANFSVEFWADSCRVFSRGFLRDFAARKVQAEQVASWPGPEGVSFFLALGSPLRGGQRAQEPVIPTISRVPSGVGTRSSTLGPIHLCFPRNEEPRREVGAVS